MFTITITTKLQFVSNCSFVVLMCEDRIGTGPPRVRTEVIHVDLGYWAILGPDSQVQKNGVQSASLCVLVTGVPRS